MNPEPLGLAPSFGFGDRIGCATAGHVQAMLRAGTRFGIEPIFPQQSIREMTRTNRTADQVMQDALHGAEQAGWTGRTGADADHLKTFEDVEVTAAAGFTFFTIDPSDHVDQLADDYDETTVREKFSQVEADADWVLAYRGQSHRLSTGTSVELDELTCLRAGVKYGLAVIKAIELGRYILDTAATAGRSCEIELSVDETDQPTTLAEHFMIAAEMRQAGVPVISLAPRFIGDFEKGVDFKGDLTALEASLNDHAAIAAELGPYKLSLHSGSDKLSMYPALARATSGRFHVKTAGTSYLEALRVAAIHDQTFFAEIVDFARGRYEVDKATYHVSATLDSADPAGDVADPVELQRQYLELWPEVPQGNGFTNPGRQILHCTFGSVLTHPELGPRLADLLNAHPDTYTEVLAEHFARHLESLGAGMST